MIRLRSAGSFSRLNPSPRQNRMGGVERSTSSTNPGRGISAALPHIEGDLDGAAPAGGGGVGDGVHVVLQAVGGRQQPLGAVVVGGVGGEVERPGAGAVGQRLGAVRVGAL